MNEPLKLCPPHLYIRFRCGDYLSDTLVYVTEVMEEDACIDCDAFANGNLHELADPDPIMDKWRGSSL